MSDEQVISDSLDVGFVGMGSMGSPMVARMAAAGHRVRVYSRRAEVAEAAQASGAVPVSTLTDVAEGADIVTICVYSSQQVREVCLGENGVLTRMRPKSVLLVHTTCPPQTMSELVAAADEREISVIDAPLDGRPVHLTEGAGRVLLGGDDEAVGRVSPALRTYASTVIRTGGVGSGQLTKVLNVLMTAAQTQLIAAAAGIAEQLGLDTKEALAAVNQTGVRSQHLESALTYADDPTAHAAMVKPFVVKDILNYGDALDGLDLGLLGIVADAVTAEERARA